MAIGHEPAGCATNLVRLKEIADNAIASFEALKAGGIDEDVRTVLPGEKTIADENSLEKLRELIEDPDADTSTFHSRLNNILNDANSRIGPNIAKINERQETFEEYISEPVDEDSGKALFAIIFKDPSVVESLPHFAKKLNRWDRTLRMYHTLVTNESPEDIGLAAVHGGSIDVVVNLDLNVAIDIAEVMKYGFVALSAYLAYRIKKSDFVASYEKNKELLALDTKQDELMLANIKSSMENVLKEKYLSGKTSRTKKTTAEAPEKKIEQISELFSEHITKGNDVKLLTSGKPDDETEETDDRADDLRQESRKASALRIQIPAKELKFLMSKYDIPEQTED